MTAGFTNYISNMLLTIRQARRLRRLFLALAFSATLVFLSKAYIVLNNNSDNHHQFGPFYVPIENQEALEAYKNRWVGFPDLSHVECTPMLIQSTRNSLYPRFIKRVSISQLALDSKDCTMFLAKYGFNRYTPVTTLEKEFPLAYAMLFHKDLYQVLVLLRAIYRSHNVYCLNVDLGAGATFVNAVKIITQCFSNVFVAQKLENIVYAGFSRFMADINCMQELVKHSVKWKYLHNLPGQQFPLRTNLELVQILNIYNGSNDFLGMPGRNSIHRRYKIKHHVIYDNITGKHLVVETADRKSPPPHGFKIIKGSAYGSFSRTFVEFILSNKMVLDLIEWSKDVESPDEYVFPTIHHTRLMDVPGGYRGTPTKKRFLASFTAWEKETPCASMFVRWICIFTPADLPLLVERQELFANKFYIDHYPAVLHCLDQYLYNLSVAGITRDLDFYRKLNFVRS